MTKGLRGFEPRREARDRNRKFDGLSFEHEYEEKEFYGMNFNMIIKEYFENIARSFNIESNEFDSEPNGTQSKFLRTA